MYYMGDLAHQDSHYARKLSAVFRERTGMPLWTIRGLYGCTGFAKVRVRRYLQIGRLPRPHCDKGLATWEGSEFATSRFSVGSPWRRIDTNLVR